MKALIHANVYDFHTYRPDSFILYDQVIREVGSMTDFKGAAKTHDCRGHLVLPGLINGHAHIYAALLRGLSLPFRPDSFQHLLEQLWWRFDRGIDLETSYLSALVHGLEHLKSGVTTIVDHHAGGMAIRGALSRLKQGICDDLGMRGIFAFETSDRFPVKDCIAENLAFIQEHTSEVCAGLFGLHASLSLSEATLKKVAAVLGDTPIHVHVAESLEDETKCIQKYQRRCLRRLADHGLLNRNSLLAHCVHIDDAEAEIAARQGCVIAVNPTSNLNNGVGLPDYFLFKRHQLPVIVGNDSLGADIARDYQNLLYSMHLQSGSPWRFSGDNVLDCIRAGYHFVGKLLGVAIGRLEPGYVADMLEIPYDPPTPLDETNIFGHLLNGVFGRFRPQEVWCQGRLRIHNYQTVDVDEAQIHAGAREAASKLWRRIGAV